MLTNFKKGLDKALSIVTTIGLIVMMLHIVLHALMRYFFSHPLYGTNEIVAFWYLPIVALLGIPAAQLQKEHITVTLVLDRMSDGTAAIFKIFACVLGAALSLGFAWFGLGEAMEGMEMRANAGVSDIIMWPVYFLVPVVFVLLAVLFVIDLLVVWRDGAPDTDLNY